MRSIWPLGIERESVRGSGEAGGDRRAGDGGNWIAAGEIGAIGEERSGMRTAGGQLLDETFAKQHAAEAGRGGGEAEIDFGMRFGVFDQPVDQIGIDEAGGWIDQQERIGFGLFENVFGGWPVKSAVEFAGSE